MLALQTHARFVITDSGGIQVETTVLGIPCLTVMDYTVWHITHSEGSNTLVGSDCARLEKESEKILKSKPKSKSKSQSQSKSKSQSQSPPLWDGQTAARIISILTRR
jgi:UDP-N-acetylglucosamine 2-epimerase (non-hydrolysing)